MVNKTQTVILNTARYPVAFLDLNDFVTKSPTLGHIVFLGQTMLTSPELPDILNTCKQHKITVEFAHCENILESNIKPIVYSGIVTHIYFLEQDTEKLTDTFAKLDKLKQKTNATSPILMQIQTPSNNPSPQPKTFEFYNLANNINSLPCAGLVQNTMINYDGLVFGCSENAAGTPINAFRIGLDATLQHKFLKRMKRMLRTGRPDVNLPCCRCPVFLSLIWTNKKIRFTKTKDTK